MSVLTAGPRDLPERQRTLRATLDWSFGLLTAGQQALFARLGVFAGTFGLPAAAAICGDAVRAGAAGEPERVMQAMGSLVDSSLVRAEPHDDEPRFSLLETVREYALDRLRDSGDWERVHDRHAAYFAALARPAESELTGAGQLAWLSRLELRHDNLGAALSWLLERDQPGPALDLVLGDLAVLVAARPCRGTAPLRGQDPGPQRRPAAAPAGPGAERCGLTSPVAHVATGCPPTAPDPKGWLPAVCCS